MLVQNVIFPSPHLVSWEAGQNRLFFPFCHRKLLHHHNAYTVRSKTLSQQSPVCLAFILFQFCRKVRTRRFCAKARDSRQTYSAYSVKYKYIIPSWGFRILRVLLSKMGSWEKVSSHTKFWSLRDSWRKHVNFAPKPVVSANNPLLSDKYHLA